jgi:hypothetical protein
VHCHRWVPGLGWCDGYPGLMYGIWGAATEAKQQCIATGGCLSGLR